MIISNGVFLFIFHFFRRSYSIFLFIHLPFHASNNNLAIYRSINISIHTPFHSSPHSYIHNSTHASTIHQEKATFLGDIIIISNRQSFFLGGVTFLGGVICLGEVIYLGGIIFLGRVTLLGGVTFLGINIKFSLRSKFWEKVVHNVLIKSLAGHKSQKSRCLEIQYTYNTYISYILRWGNLFNNFDIPKKN